MYNRQDPFITLPLIAPDEQFIMMYPIQNYIDIPYGAYMISNYGRLFTLLTHNCIPKDITPPNPTKDGYKDTLLYNFDFSNRFRYRIHRLVMIYFNFDPNCNTLFVNHKNGIKDDNRLCNLEWMTNQENQIHAIRVLGSIKTSLDDETVNKIRLDVSLGALSLPKIAEKYNTTYDIVRTIAYNKSYNYVERDSAEQLIYDEAKHLSPETVLNIYYESYKRVDDETIAKQFNVPVRTVMAIRINHPAYRDILGTRKPIKHTKTTTRPNIPSEDKALSIYYDKKAGLSGEQISQKYNVSHSLITDICQCKANYEYLKYKYKLEPIIGATHNNVKSLSEQEVLEIYNTAKTSGKINKELTEMYGISMDRLISIKKCKGAFSYLKTKYNLDPL